MAETVSVKKPKIASISNTTKTSRKIRNHIPISISTSSFIFFLISFSLLSISLLSLSSKDSTFWFFLSNSIIFFVAAADSYSSSPSKPDFYRDYLKLNNTPRNAYSYTTYCTLHPPDSTPHPCTDSKDSKEDVESLQEKEKTSAPKYPRSKSDESVGGEKKILCGSNSGNGGQLSSDGSDLSAMSDEELNRRVEEFIRRFNKEILLQEMKEPNEKQEI